MWFVLFIPTCEQQLTAFKEKLNEAIMLLNKSLQVCPSHWSLCYSR